MTQRLSASRLNEYLDCAHASALWLDGVVAPEKEDASLELVRKKGFEHEAVVLARLEAQLGPAVSIASSGRLSDRASVTQDAIEQGAPLIYQGALFNERWVGYPDFLVRVDGEGGGWAYRAEDAKLARKAKSEHVLQLGVYRRLLDEAAGRAAPQGAIHVGGGGDPESFDLTRTAHVTARYMDEFEGFANSTDRRTRPLPSSACGRCAFQPRCEAEWREADSPTFVAGLRGDQLLKLEKAGVTTLAQLAALSPEVARIPGIGAETLPKLIAQARLQAGAREAGRHSVEVLPSEPNRGFALMPSPAAGDLFFDMEGYPHDPGGLEYLFGLYGPLAADGSDAFKGIWAHDSAAEKVAFEQLMDLFVAHLDRYPQAHIYHYAAYETVALKKLASRYATREAELDRLLREQRFVDLYRVAKQGLRASTEGYSLKQLEKIYWGQRAGEVTNAGDSIVEYERWRDTGDGAILEAIERYNEDDCVSTAKLRDWLEGLRPVDAVYGLATSNEAPQLDERAEARQAFERQRHELARRVRSSSAGSEPVRELVAELLWFHQRANKPQWWSLFDRQTWTDEELMEDLEGLGGLELVGQESLPKPARSDLATYRFPPQETKLRKGQSCRIAETLESAGTIEAVDAAEGVIVLKRGSKKGEFPSRCGISPNGPLDQDDLVAAVMAFAERVAAGELEDDRALMDLLLRRHPALAGRERGRPILNEGEDLVDGTIRAVRDLDQSYLFIQGPPGTGKTYTSSHAILAVLQDGARVAVASNSHKAINNLLAAVEERATERGFQFDGVKKASRGDPETEHIGRLVANVYDSKDVLPSHQLVGGTAFHFCKADESEFDYLFVDEAGQVCLANLVAMAACARNIVLIGDQMQLPQPVQGVHPGETGLSCLEYLLQERATVPPELGILLNVSWRMHPKVCGLISSAIYDGRLVAHETAAKRAIIGASDLPEAGIVHVPVAHEGCRQSSAEEAAAVAELLAKLTRATVREADGAQRRLGPDDVLIVAPYNAQVNLLRARLPDGARVGTVDKFQGQEAPVVIVSMATSRGAEAPRGTEFLFNRNRLNVAISRAKCLAIVVSSSTLLDSMVGDVEDLVRLDLVVRIEANAAARVE